MMRRTIAFRALFYFVCLAGMPDIYSQCPQFPTSSIAGATGTLCEGASVTLSATALGIPQGSFLDWYIGPNSSYNPYTGQGSLIGQIPIEITCNNTPEVLYIMVNPDNTQVGGPDDKCDEFLVLWTGSGGFSTTDISVTNLGNGSFSWTDFVAGNASSFSCGVSLPPGPVPPNAILIIQGSPTNNVLVNIDNLCNSGLPVYIIANNNVDCTGGFFDNNSPCSSCPVMVNIGGTCPANLNINYMPPAATIDGWGWSNMGSGVFADVVPPVNIPMYVPDEIIVDDFVWTIPSDFCETMAGGNWFITGILDPPPAGACPDIFTQYFLLDISCPELNISGGGDVCVGNCPGNPTEINFQIVGGDVPFTADINVSVSGFPPLPINDLPISNGQKILVCMGGIFPSFDPVTGILQVPVFAVGVNATVVITSLISASGCVVNPDPNFITLNFIDAPTANAGNDVEICSGEDVMLNGSIGGSATDAQWTTNGDGDFADPFNLNTIYSPGPLDITNGSVQLTLTSMDVNGSCTPATSMMTITFDPPIMIDLGPPLTVCDNDVVNLSVMMTGGTATGEWNTSGDGSFDDPFSEITFYTPGPNDFNIGFVTITFVITDPNACVGNITPLQVTFVYAPQVVVPQNVEICQDESALIQITISGSYSMVNWSVIGDGQLVINSETDVSYTPGPLDISNGSAIISVTVTSSFSQCGQTTYSIPVMITPCNCPPFQTSVPSSPLCAVADILDLSTLLVTGGPGQWTISSTPPGSNPATINGTNFITNSSDPGIYTVTYTLDNPQAGCPFTSSEMINVVGVIVPDAGPDIANCGPGAIAVIGNPLPSLPASILWETLGDGSFSNPNSQATIYTPGSLDSISPGIKLVFHIIDPLCGNQSDTMNIQFNTPVFALFANDTFSICNETDKGSVINFPSLIAGGDATGIWTNTSGVPVDFSNPSSVDFNGIAAGYYLFTYQTNSAVAPCQDKSYSIIISVKNCLCPIITIQSLPGGICNSQQELELNAFVMAGAPGTWVVLSTPPGNNPATVIGSKMQILGADPGTYRMRFTFDSAPIVACPDSAEIDVFIQDQPLVSISDDTAICGVNDIPLNSIIGGSATNVTWSSSGSGSFNNPLGLTPIYSPSNADLNSGQVRVIGRTIDTLGFCVDALDTMYINLSKPPYTTWSALIETVCNQQDSGSVVNFVSFMTGGDLSGLWSDEDGAQVDLSNPSNVDFDGVIPGTYHFKYTTQSAIAPCTDSSYIFQVFVEDCACPPLQIRDISSVVCIPTPIDLNALLIDAAPGSWSIYDGPASATWPVIIGNEVNTDNADPGQYFLKYLLIDSVAGCPASKIIPFTLEDSPILSSIDFDCDADLLNYSVIIHTNANTVTSDFGVVVPTGAGIFTIKSIPAGQNISLELFAASGICSSSTSVLAPNCACTLMIEDLSDTIFLCRGDTFTLIPLVTGATGIPFSTWIGPDFVVHSPSFKIYEDGTYIWVVMDSLCEKRDTFNVKLYDSVLLDAEALPPFCPGGDDGMIIILNISLGKEPYTLQLDSDPPFLIDVFPDTIRQVASGDHQITITDLNGCETEFSVTVPDPSDRLLSLGPDVVIDKGDSVLINPVLTNISVSSYSWIPDTFGLSIQPKWISPQQTTLLALTVTDSSGCVFQDDLLITVLIEKHFYIPTVFSPNGDQINDVLVVETSDNPIDIRSLEIFDRWGNLVYDQHDSPPFKWDGTFKNKLLMPGVYVLKLVWNDDNGNENIYVKDLTLIR